MSIAEPPVASSQRRDFFKKAVSGIIGGVLALCPTLAGLIFATDPLRRRAVAGGPVRVATLTSLPNDGIPRKFAVVADQLDAWNKYHNVPIGAVYLRRTGDKTVQAFNVICPHLGCFVEYKKEKGAYYCPCHNSSFTAEGGILDRKSPSRRGLDSLTVEIREGSEIWVHFQNFKAGQAEKIPTA